MNREGYNVFRFIEQGSVCHIGSDYIEGSPMITYLKYHPIITKDVLFKWVKDLEKKLNQFHNTKGHAYDYVSPLSIIVSDDLRVHLVDLDLEENKSIRQKMERNSVKAQFCPRSDSGLASFEVDKYSLGKTIQYILSVSEIEPQLRKHEEYKIKQIIKKSVGDYGKDEKIKSNSSGRKYQVACVVVIIAIALATKVFYIGGDTSNSVNARDTTDTNKVDTNRTDTYGDSAKEIELRFRMGMLYLEEMEDYTKASEMLSSISEEYIVAQHYLDLSDFLNGKSEKNVWEMGEILKMAENTYPKEELLPIITLLRCNTLIESVESYENVLRISNRLKGSEEINDEVLVYRINAFDKLNRIEEALEDICSLLESVSYIDSKDEYYGMAAVIYKDRCEMDKAYETIERGIKVYPDGMELRILDLSYHIYEESNDIENIKRLIDMHLADIPEIKNTESFIELCNDNNIKIEDDKAVFE
ncbi:MAG: hypothetical protein ACK5LL_16000 [Suipraeoptans sp.]